MEYNSQIIEKFGGDKGWGRLMRPIIESEVFDNIFRHLKARKAQGAQIIPNSPDLFRCFIETPPDKLRVLFIGLCPYHTIDDKTKECIADGLMFSCGKTDKPQASLSAFWEGYEQDVYQNVFNPKFKPKNDLKYLANEGVMLYNCQLSVEPGKAGIHAPIWEPFTKMFIEEVINKTFSGIPVIMFGSVAGKCEKLLNPMQNYTKVVEHPAAQAYKGGEQTWKHDNLFTWVNRLLWENNKYIIDWEGKGENAEYPAWVTEKPQQSNDEWLRDLQMPVDNKIHYK